MKLVVYTQYLENYGAHDWDGKGLCPSRWKHKGGDTIVVAELTTQQAIEIAQAGNMHKLMADRVKEHKLTWRNEYSEQYLIDWELIDDDELTIVWDDPSLSYFENERRADRYSMSMNWSWAGMVQDVVNNRTGISFTKREAAA